MGFDDGVEADHFIEVVKEGEGLALGDMLGEGSEGFDGVGCVEDCGGC